MMKHETSLAEFRLDPAENESCRFTFFGNSNDFDDLVKKEEEEKMI